MAEAHFSTTLQVHQVFASGQGVKWTSPRHCTHHLYSLHLAVTRTCKKQEKYTVKKSPEARGKKKWRARRDLNSQPSGSKPDALSN
jgi:hypothetical protein